MARTIIRADGVEEDTLEDKDGDTKVQVEESSDGDKIRFDTGGTERMIITDAGLVGIGTSSPDNTLHVKSAGTTHVKVESEAGSEAALKLKSGTQASVYVWQPGSGADLRFYVNGADRMHLDNDGNTGIGTTTPIAKLDVAGKIAITSEVATPSAPADGKGWLYTKSDGKLYWQSNDVSETDLTAGGGGGSGDITAVSAGVGLSGGATSGAATLTIDFSEFSTVTPADGDFLATLDSDGSTEQKTAISALATLMAGSAASTGLSASSSVLSVSDLHPVGVDGSANQLMTDDGDGTMTSESKALVDGAKITIGDGTAEDTLLVFDGNAADFRIGIDDDSDTLEIGAGAAHDTTAAIIVYSSGHVTKIGQDSPSSDQVLTWDGSKAVWSAASGGSSNEYYHLTLSGRVRNTNGNLHGHGAYPYNAGDADWTTSLSSYVSNWTTGDTSFDATYANGMLYFTIGVAPAAMSLTSARIAYYMANDNMTDDYIWEVWKATPTSGTDYTTSLSWSRIGQLDRGGDPVATAFYAASNTFSSSNTLAAGDLIGLTVHNPGDTYTSKYHGYHLVLRFTYS